MHEISPGVPNGNRQSVALFKVHPFKVHPSIQLKESGLLFSSTPSLDAWEAIGRQILSVAESSTWWIADWLAYGEEVFQDRYLEAVKRTNLNYQTLRNYVWVARRFEQSRRRDTLSFGHHAEVAALEVAEQEYWLRKADELNWSRNQLRREVRASLREREGIGTSPDGGNTEPARGARHATLVPVEVACRVLMLELTDEQVARFSTAADALHLSLDEWATTVLEAAARNGSHVLVVSRRRDTTRGGQSKLSRSTRKEHEDWNCVDAGDRGKRAGRGLRLPRCSRAASRRARRGEPDR